VSSDWPGVSVVMPVLNEERHLEAAVAGVLSQEYPGPLEVVLAVGPSRDATRAIADQIATTDPRVRVVDNPASRTPHALNLAVAAASHDVIVRVDGHGMLTDGYIRRAVELLDETGAANVGGVMDAQGSTPFEEAVAAAYTTKLGLGGSSFHLAESPAGPTETVFLGVFRREALRSVGGFDETMHRAQDWELNHRLIASGQTIWFSPELRVTYRPRSSVRALAKQMYDTGKWRREVIRRYPDTANVRYLAPPVATATIAVASLLGLAGSLTGSRLLRLAWAAPAGYVALIVAGSAVTSRSMSDAARVRLPVVLAVTHLSWGAGFLVGLRRPRSG
jgi:succinoglycan biosynthesis protein ExoA